MIEYSVGGRRYRVTERPVTRMVLVAQGSRDLDPEGKPPFRDVEIYCGGEWSYFMTGYKTVKGGYSYLSCGEWGQVKGYRKMAREAAVGAKRALGGVGGE